MYAHINEVIFNVGYYCIFYYLLYNYYYTI